MLNGARHELQRELVRAEAARRGVTIARRGRSWQLTGPGVDVSVADLAMLEPRDLVPYTPRKEGGAWPM